MTAARDVHKTRLEAFGEAFADATRRAVYHRAAESPVPLSAAEVAAGFGVHRTVARAHLEKLVEMGLLRAAARRTGAGGRPAKVYSASAQRIDLTLPPRCYESLARLLLDLVSTLPAEIEPAALALAVGRAYGRGLAHAGELDDGPARPAGERALEWLISAGYAAELDSGPTGARVLSLHNCVYKELAVSAPAIVCAFDRGMLRALFGVADGDHEQTLSIVDGDSSCRHEFTL